MIELLHDFYTNEICNDFRFIPDRHTFQLLNHYNALYKTAGNKLIVLIKVNEDGKPFIEPKETDRFVFFLELMKPAFMTVSGVDLLAMSAKRFYFSNVHQNKVTISANNDLFYLNEKIESYKTNTDYFAGNMVEKGGVTYECIKDCKNKVPPQDSFWFGRDKKQYATGKDMLQLVTRQQTFQLETPANMIDVSVFAFNPSNKQFDVNVQQQSFRFEENVESVVVDFSSLPEAKYKVIINGAEKLVYMSNDAVYGNVLGVIDLYNNLPAGDDFSFFKADGKTKDEIIAGKNKWLNFSVRFANRLAYWKYVIKNKGVDEIEGSNGYTFSGNDHPAETFISQKPIPLSEQPYEFKLKLFETVSAEPPLAPNPDMHSSGMLTKDGTDYYCNIYLNY